MAPTEWKEFGTLKPTSINFSTILLRYAGREVEADELKVRLSMQNPGYKKVIVTASGNGFKSQYIESFIVDGVSKDTALGQEINISDVINLEIIIKASPTKNSGNINFVGTASFSCS